MHFSGLSRVFVIAGALSLRCSCLPDNHTDDQVNTAISSGTFKNPSANFRPRFRYWVPDASVNLSRVRDDITYAAAAGAGGVELLGYYLYDSEAGDVVPTDWTIYGWGTPAWKELFDTVIKAHQDFDLVMDFAMGPNQGQGVPGHEDDDGLMWDLQPYNISVPLGGSFHDILPGWDTGPLVAVVSGLVTSSSNIPKQSNTFPTPQVQKTLSACSLRDITENVTKYGRLDVDFPSDQPGLEYIIFAMYNFQNHDRNQADPATLIGPETRPQDFVQNGSFIADHFSARGAKVITDFWERHLLVDGTKAALRKVGNFGWEDSCEINPILYWTRDLPKQFEASRGYSINRWLPLLFYNNHRPWRFTVSGLNTYFVTDEPDAGQSHVDDYHTTLAEGYADYLKALTNWTNSYLGLQYSAQVSYNMAMDMQTNIANVNAPECETLGFDHSIDAYRQYAGPANLAGKRIISTECGAISGQVFQQTLPELLWDVKRSLAGSVNNFIFHGLAYSGNYGPDQPGGASWPTFTTFSYHYSEMHGRHQPAWDFYSEPMNFTARNSYIFQTGVPKMDLAFYQKSTHTEVGRNYEPTDLEQTGYSYEYLNPDNLQFAEATVQSGVLARQRQAFKASIVRGNDTLTVPGATRIRDLALAGLPVIFSGGIPSALAGFNVTGITYVQQALNNITWLDNVHIVAYDNLADKISSLGIKPMTKVSANATWHTYWRNDDAEAVDYVFVYNDALGSPLGGGWSEGTVEFQSTGKPYLYDAWTGAQTPILEFTQTNTSTIIPFKLAGNQSAIIAFKCRERPGLHALSTSANVLSIIGSGSSLTALVDHGTSPGHVATSDGCHYSVKPTSAAPFQLHNWTLVTEHWDPPAKLSDIDRGAQKQNTTHQLPSLTSWQNIDGLQNVAGRGYYNTTFQWVPSADATGARLSFGGIVHTVRAWVNGHLLPPLDTTDATADITPYLVNGTNSVQAVVSTTLANVVIPIWNELQSPPLTEHGAVILGPNPLPTKQDYGLLCPVVVEPYNAVPLTSCF